MAITATHWTYIIGDVHGCFDALRKLEERCVAHAQSKGFEAFFVSVGDLIDRGSHSLEVVSHFARGVAKGTHAVVGGNHEAELFNNISFFAPECLESLAVHVLGKANADKKAIGGPDALLPCYASGFSATVKFSREVNQALSFEDYCARLGRSWLRQGGEQTIVSFGADPVTPASWKDMDTVALEFLYGLPLHWENENVVVTHALASSQALGFARQVDGGLRTVDRQSAFDFNQLESILWSRVPPEVRPDATRTHVSGHTPAPFPTHHLDATCLVIDTGCVYGHALTAWCAETGDFLAQPK